MTQGHEAWQRDGDDAVSRHRRLDESRGDRLVKEVGEALPCVRSARVIGSEFGEGNPNLVDVDARSTGSLGLELSHKPMGASHLAVPSCWIIRIESR